MAVPRCVSIAMLAVYNGSGFSDGEPNGETNAHYLEFAFEMINRDCFTPQKEMAISGEGGVTGGLDDRKSCQK